MGGTEMNVAYTQAEAITLIVWAPTALGFFLATVLVGVDYFVKRRRSRYPKKG